MTAKFPSPPHGLSPTLESLIVVHNSISLSEFFGLVCSFPSLENLTLVSTTDRDSTCEWALPPTSQKFTGSLHLGITGGSTVRGLLDLPGGLHFLTSGWVL